MVYLPRVLDVELDEHLQYLPAVAITGAKGVGKTATAARRAVTTVSLDDPHQLEVFAAQPDFLTQVRGPILLDEWQRFPQVWDQVRRQVDDGAPPGRYLLTGSATVPAGTAIHSGSGRIAGLKMRPLSLAERGLTPPTVSLADLLLNPGTPIEGHCQLTAVDYAQEITASGLPGIRPLPARQQRLQLATYLDELTSHEFAEQGVKIRKSHTLRAWLTAYAAATASTANYSTILDAATPGEADKPTRRTVDVYRDVLAQLWMLDPLPGWTPNYAPLGRLAKFPKHFLADPALAVSLLGLTTEDLLTGTRPTRLPHQPHPMLGALFEHLVALSMQVYAQPNEAHVYHCRDKNNRDEVDIIVETGSRVAAFEVKLSRTISDEHVKGLRWLKDKIGDNLVNAVVVSTGSLAYRRPDGIAVIPAALLGP